MENEKNTSNDNEINKTENASNDKDQVTSQDIPALSRNQQKKLVRLEKQLQFKALKRKKERELRKLNGKNNKAVIEKADGEKVTITRKSLKKNRMCDSPNKLKIVIDCSFEKLMGFSDIRHFCKQLGYCYAANRRMTSPLQLYLTSINDTTKEILEKSGLSNWDVNLNPEHYLDVFKEEAKENICYLTSDSPNELTEFDDKKIYIIGGLVDHNHHKSLCYDLAVKNNLMHYRLPINKYMHMKTRPVLTVNQVFDIICKYVECKDWEMSFINTLPKRKGAEAKSESKVIKEELTDTNTTDKKPESDDEDGQSQSKKIKSENE